MYLDGVCIIEDFFDNISNATKSTPSNYQPPLFSCSDKQANYICKAGRNRDVIFDNVVRSSDSTSYETPSSTDDRKTKSLPINGPVPRQQLRCCKANQAEMAKYEEQMELILKSIFLPSDGTKKTNPKNWRTKMTNVVGGLEYQHAHADQGWPMEYEGETLFPFVATHGFGKYPYQLWLFPRSIRGKSEYGFLHNLSPTSLVLMRGDFVHAGGVSWLPRCHMKFYPTVAAGYIKGHNEHYWNHPKFQCDIDEENYKGSQIERSFLWQHYTFPFACPKYTHVRNKETHVVEEFVSYPPSITHDLLDEARNKRLTARTNKAQI